MSSMLALVSKSLYEKQAKPSGAMPVVGEVLPFTDYWNTPRLLDPLADGGSLFLVTARPPYDRLLLVAELVSPTHRDGVWRAAPNQVGVTDISHLVDRFAFADGKGLRAAKQLGSALQRPKVLKDDDISLLREAVATSSDPVAAIPLPEHDAALVESLLGECLALAPAEPAQAFTAARRAWQLTRWPRLARVAERLALLGESDAARKLRKTKPGGDWTTLAQSLPDIDRGALLTGLPNLTAVEVLGRLEHIAEWEPDPRVGRALIALLRSVPWTMYGADPTWNRAFQILFELHDPRLSPLGDEFDPSSWLGERIDGLVHRLIRHPVPPSWAGADQLLSGVEHLLDGLDEAGQPGSPLPPAVPAALPPAVQATAPHDFTAVGIVDVRRRGTVFGIEITVGDENVVLVTDDAGMGKVAVPGERWALDPRGERLAILGEELAVFSTADGARLASVPWPEGDHSPQSDLVWATDDWLVAGTSHGWVRFDLGTGTATAFDGPAWRRGGAIAVDPESSIVLRWGWSDHSYPSVHSYDLRDGRLTQAFDIDAAYSKFTTAVPLGSGRFVLGCFIDGSPSDGPVLTTVDGVTGWDDTVPQTIPLPGDPDDVVAVFREPPSLYKGTIDRWMFGDGSAVRATKAGELGFLDPGGDKPVRRITVAAPALPHLAVSPDGHVIACTDGETAMIWGGKPRGTRLTFSDIRHVGVSRSGRVAVVAGERFVLAGPDGKRIGTTKYRGLTRVAGCAAHDLFAAITWQSVVVFDEGLNLSATFRLPADARAATGPEEDRSASFSAIAWNRTGRSLAASTDQGRLLLIDAATAEQLLDVDVSQAVRDVAFLPTRDALLVWTDPDLLLIVDRATGRVEKWRQAPGVTGLAVHQTHGWVATGHQDGLVTLFDAGDPESSSPVGRHLGPVTALAFAEDRLVVGAGRPGHRGSITTYQWAAPAAGETGTMTRQSVRAGGVR